MPDSMTAVVADDVMLTREGVVGILRRAGIDVIGQATDGEELLRKVEAARPQVAITDIRMPPTHTDEGIVAAREIRRRHPDVGVLVLSQYMEPRFAMELLEDTAGGAGYLLKERVSDAAVLVDAIRRVVAGECVVDHALVSLLMGRQRHDSPLARLSTGELDVLALMAEGKSNVAIAAELFVAPRTVEARTTQIFDKLGLSQSAELHRRVLAVLTFLRQD